jgi:hypothetical protein
MGEYRNKLHRTDTCANGHKYPSRKALLKQPIRVPVKEETNDGDSKQS